MIYELAMRHECVMMNPDWAMRFHDEDSEPEGPLPFLEYKLFDSQQRLDLRIGRFSRITYCFGGLAKQGGPSWKILSKKYWVGRHGVDLQTRLH